ncbi:MAG: D-alanyl-D-alanine carboxypeptidase/D-alanyl-D-alanine-endopeptidase [Flavobacteriales bacterium CG_4_9_14_3_um_filter_32_8]|nr:MAG: D-alanyl-D-alanine carboxypeptidase/D-alanyl-D-alanine-endopeptidase [Flavobacteriales bacterium CG_4_9_14_3_um_filter_32_8]
MKNKLLIVLSLLSFQLSSQTIAEVRTVVQKFAADPDLKNASISFYALDLDSNKVIAGLGSDLSLVPASTMKLVTTATALEILGADKRFATTIKYSGEIDSTMGVLNGNIYIVGGGDPCLGSERFKKQYGDFINKWANEIIKLGIKQINGSVIGDASIFSEQMIPSTWIWGDLGNYYGAGPCGLTIYDNTCTIELQSGKKGDSTVVKCISPFIPNLELENDVKSMLTTKDESYIFGAPYQEYRIIKGGVPINEKAFLVSGSIPDPAYLTAFELDMELRSLGIKIANPATTVRKIKLETTGSQQPKRKTITTTWSPKLISIINLTNTYSINLYAEHLVNQIGVFKYGSGDTGSGTLATQNFWAANGLDSDGFYVNDGSGLSRFNGVTAKQLVGILQHMYKSKNKQLFINSLPVAGKSGTLINVGKGSAAAGKIHAKSGYMTRVRSYAGYVTTKNKKNVAFALIVNNFNCTPSQMKTKMEKIMIKLAEIEK